MKKTILLIAILGSLTSLHAQEIYFNTGKNYTNYNYKNSSGSSDNNITKYNYKNSSGSSDNNLQAGTGFFYELGYVKALKIKNLNYAIGINLNEYNALGGNFVNSYSWHTEYLGIQNTLLYSVIKNKNFDIAAKAGIGLSTIIYGKQELNGVYYDLLSQKEFSGLLLAPSLGFQTKCTVNDNLYFSIGYNFLKTFNVTNSTSEKLNFDTSQFQFGIHLSINNKKSSKETVIVNKENNTPFVENGTINKPDKEPVVVNPKPIELLEKTKATEVVSKETEVPNPIILDNPNVGTIVASSLVNKAVFNFSSKSLNVLKIDEETLNKAVTYLKNNPDKTVLINGFASSDGTIKQNYMLSLKRANIAQEYFIINGISPNRIKTLGKGATNPKYSNETLEGRLKNKRVELEFN